MNCCRSINPIRQKTNDTLWPDDISQCVFAVSSAAVDRTVHFALFRRKPCRLDDVPIVLSISIVGRIRLRPFDCVLVLATLAMHHSFGRHHSVHVFASDFTSVGLDACRIRRSCLADSVIAFAMYRSAIFVALGHRAVDPKLVQSDTSNLGALSIIRAIQRRIIAGPVDLSATCGTIPVAPIASDTVVIWIRCIRHLLHGIGRSVIHF
jgi:hypothetical protein